MKNILIISIITIVILILIYYTFNKTNLMSMFNKETKNNTSSNLKIILIGLDGAEWNIIMPLVSEGKLPNIAKLLENGAYGNMSTIGWGSPTIWTSIATSKTPDEHGIQGFLIKENSSLENEIIKSYDRKCKAIWNIASENEKHVDVINYLVTYPPEKVNGLILPSICENGNKTNFNCTAEEYDCVIKTSYNCFDEVTNLSKYLYKSFDKLDIFITYQDSLDIIQHYFWKFIEPQYYQDKIWNLTPQNIEKYNSTIKDFYHYEIDPMIGDFIKNSDENTIVIIVSDHGFQAIKHYPPYNRIFINFNNMLEKMGLLYFINNSAQIDFSKTKVYSCDDDAWDEVDLLCINPNFKDSKDQIIKSLSSLTLLNGTKIFNSVAAKENSSYKSMVTDFDIAVEETNITNQFEDNRYVIINGEKYLLNDFLTFDDISGNHRSNAVIIMSGKIIKNNYLIKNASIYDITPTILYLIGLPIAKDMKGNLLTDALSEDFIKNNPIKYIDTYETQLKNDKNTTTVVNKETEEKIKEKLKELGYIV